jgi:hypothetical protein
MCLTPVDGAHSRTLERALQIVGSRDRLATTLGVPLAELESYLARKQPVSNYVFLAALDIVRRRSRPQVGTLNNF